MWVRRGTCLVVSDAVVRLVDEQVRAVFPNGTCVSIEHREQDAAEQIGVLLKLKFHVFCFAARFRYDGYRKRFLSVLDKGNLQLKPTVRKCLCGLAVFSTRAAQIEKQNGVLQSLVLGRMQDLASEIVRGLTAKLGHGIDLTALRFLYGDVSRFDQLRKCYAEVKRTDDTVLNDNVVDLNEVQRSINSGHQGQYEYFNISHFSKGSLQCFSHSDLHFPWMFVLFYHILQKSASLFF